LEVIVKALAWHGKGDIRCDDVRDPRIEHPRDAIIKVSACAICGSDLHIYGGIIPSMQSGDVLGHESMGEVVEVGSNNKALKVGDRVVVRSRSHVANVCSAGTDSTPAANVQIRITTRPPSCRAIPREDCSDTRTCSEDMPAAKRSSCASLTRM
jgi:D-arabinose 1-dehydrogenase-like Zn-dependent alcohol dehydrogenase